MSNRASGSVLKKEPKSFGEIGGKFGSGGNVFSEEELTFDENWFKEGAAEASGGGSRLRPMSPEGKAAFFRALDQVRRRNQQKYLSLSELTELEMKAYLKFAAYAEISYDCKKGEFSIDNFDEVKREVEKDSELRQAIPNFQRIISEFLNFLHQRADFVYGRNIEYKPKIIDPQTRYYYKSRNPRVFNRGVKKRYLPFYLRASGQEWLNEDDFNIYFNHLVQEIFINSFVIAHLDDVGIDSDALENMKCKFSKYNSSGFEIHFQAPFFRDYYFNLGSKICMVQSGLQPAKLRSISALRHDLEKNGLDLRNDVIEVPFIVEGGNFIVLEDRKIVLFFMDHNNFSHETYSNEKESEENSFSLMKYVSAQKGEYIVVEDVRNYNQAKAIIVEWFEKQGYNAINLQRNLENNSLGQVYHLDTVLNVIGGEVLVVARESIMPSSLRKLQEIFGDNIIYLDEEERSRMVSNFIDFGPDVLMSYPMVNQSDRDIMRNLIYKFNQQGISVIFPEIYLGEHPGIDGLRCRTQEIPEVLLQKSELSNVVKPSRSEKVEAASYQVSTP